MQQLSPDDVAVLRVTLQVALSATALLALPALGIGYLLARASFPGKSMLETLVTLPLVLPPTAIGYLLLELFSRRGPLGSETLGFDPGLLFTWRGAVLATAVVAFPLAARTARVAFEGVDPRLFAMARSLGLSRWRVLATIALPLARRGLSAALLLGFARALGEFGATVIVAGNIPGRTQTLALAIFQDIQLGEQGHALFLVGICAGLAFATVFAVERLLAPRQGTHVLARRSSRSACAFRWTVLRSSSSSNPTRAGSGSSGPRAPGRRRCSRRSPAGGERARGASRLGGEPGSTRSAGSRRRSRHAASATCPRRGCSSRTGACART